MESPTSKKEGKRGNGEERRERSHGTPIGRKRERSHGRKREVSGGRRREESRGRKREGSFERKREESRGRKRERSLGRRREGSIGRRREREGSSRDAGRHDGKNGGREESRGDLHDRARDLLKKRSKEGRRGSSSKRADDRESIGRGRSRDKTRGRDGWDKEESGVSVKVEAGEDRGKKNAKPKEVWEAPTPGTWQPTERSGVPAWEKSKLKKKENPVDWVQPPNPKVDLSLHYFKTHFDPEVPVPPVTLMETKEGLLLAHEIPEDDPVMVRFPRGYVRTTRRGLKESKRAREKEEREMEEQLGQRGGSSRRGRGRERGGVNPNTEPVSSRRGFEEGSRDRGGRNREKGMIRYKDKDLRAFKRDDRGGSRDGGRCERSHSKGERKDKRCGSGNRDNSGERKNSTPRKKSRSGPKKESRSSPRKERGHSRGRNTASKKDC